MHVIGTAGHVDHGKSTLVRALTGIDPDRLQEEKERGLTIDLGFAWLSLPSGELAGIIDVPGHERFIKNMLAGAASIDCVLFVVAANEGWMPQTQEHLDVLGILGIRSGVIAITKADLVDEKRLDEVTRQVQGRLSKSSLSSAPIIPVSIKQSIAASALAPERASKQALRPLVDALWGALRAAPPALDLSRPRLPIDRVFTIKGSGTVVTGTLSGGFLNVGEEVEILPQGVQARIRSIENHGNRTASAPPGGRAALNLVGIEAHEASRGDVVVRRYQWRPTSRVLALMELLEGARHDLSEKGAFKFYIGSAEIDCSMRFLNRKILHPGQDCFAAFTFRHPTICAFADRFVLRDAGRRETLGGGVVLETHADERTSQLPAISSLIRRREASARDFTAILIEERGFISKSELEWRTGLDADNLHAALADGAIITQSFVFSNEYLDRITELAVDAVRRHHDAHPAEPGMDLHLLRAAMDIDLKAAAEALECVVKLAKLETQDAWVRLPGYTPRVSPKQTGAIISFIETEGLTPSNVSDLTDTFEPAVIRAMLHSKELIQVGDKWIYTSDQLADIRERVRSRFADSRAFTVAEFRDLIGTSRKFAVPLLEHFDMLGFTRRLGEVHKLRVD